MAWIVVLVIASDTDYMIRESYTPFRRSLKLASRCYLGVEIATKLIQLA